MFLEQSIYYAVAANLHNVIYRKFANVYEGEMFAKLST